jgi:hypothetical protein
MFVFRRVSESCFVGASRLHVEQREHAFAVSAHMLRSPALTSVHLVSTEFWGRRDPVGFP